MHSLIFVIMKDLCADSPSITILTECALRLTKDGDKVNIVIVDFYSSHFCSHSYLIE